MPRHWRSWCSRRCAAGEDPGALRVLRAYERWRKSEVALMSAAIDVFDRLLAHGTGPVARVAQAGFGVVNRSQELRRFFIRRALGLEGELPQRGARALGERNQVHLRRAHEVVLRQPATACVVKLTRQ